MSVKKLSEKPSVDETACVSDCRLGRWTEIGARTIMQETTLGDYSYVTHDCEVIYTEIGKFCSIASHTRLNPGNHPLNKASLHHFTYRSIMYDLNDSDDDEFFEWRKRNNVVIGHDVWIGHGAVVLPSTRIGIGAVVGAGAVVTKDVAPFSIVAGVPARLIRKRTNEETEEAMMRIQWWNWSGKRLQEALHDFRSLSLEEFALKFDPE